MGVAEHPEPLRAVVIAFGANLGPKDETIPAAAARLAAEPGVYDLKLSSLHESVAITLAGADPDAPRYLNAVALANVSLSPAELLALLHQLEAEFGRDRSTGRWSARTLDLDLINYADHLSDAPQLLLPHPRAHERDFVLAPWLELDPSAVLPTFGAVSELLLALREGEDEAH